MVDGRTGCAAGLAAAAALTAVVFWALAAYLPTRDEAVVPRIIWVPPRAIAALPVALEMPALGLFSLLVGLGGGFALFAGLARLSGRPL